WQVRIHGRQAADYRIHHGETLAVPGGLIEILEHGPPSLSPVKRVPRIDLYQLWPRRINTGNLRQVHTRNVLDICSRDSLRVGYGHIQNFLSTFDYRREDAIIVRAQRHLLGGVPRGTPPLTQCLGCRWRVRIRLQHIATRMHPGTPHETELSQMKWSHRRLRK